MRAPSGDMTFTWEIRRHGGIVLQKGIEGLGNVALARSEGEHAMVALSQLSG